MTALVIKSEIAKMGKVVKEANSKDDQARISSSDLVPLVIRARLDSLKPRDGCRCVRA